MKADRQRTIAELIRSRSIRSQEELAKLLAQQGDAVTQATLSRDLEEMGAFKSRGSDGRARYKLPDDPAESSSEWLTRMLREFALDISASANLVVIRTPPGGANPVARALDAAEVPAVLGTVAGDDTILVVCREQAGGAKVVRHLRSLIRFGDIKEA